MSFAYIEGQEAIALEYFENQLKRQDLTTDQRKDMEAFVEKLKGLVKKTKQQPSQNSMFSFSLHYSPALAE